MSMEGPGARFGSGPRAVEAGLLAELEVACAQVERDPALLARPLRVVVSSGALRVQLSCALALRGRARVGVQVQTLDALAREILDRAGESAAPSLLYSVAVREAARRESALARDLDALDDGYAAAVASVDDLLDAGFTELHLDPLLERAADAVGGAALARACALLRVAARVSQELAGRTLGHRCAELARASDLLRADAALLPARALWIHGFNDATGVQLDLLETLALCFETRIWLDRPATHRAGAFGARLRERLAPVTVFEAEPAPDATLRASLHEDPESEARAAAAWARERIDAGTAPESIAIAARDLGRHRFALRRQLDRFGVPFSGVGERGAVTPGGRHLSALCELIERGGAIPAERWLDACARGPAAEPADLRDALHRLGIATLADLAATSHARWRDGVPLAARVGLSVDEHGAPRAPRRWVSADRLAALRETAIAAMRHLESEPGRASLAEHAARLTRLIDLLRWSDATPGRADLLAALESLADAGDRPVRREDWTRVLRRALAEASTDPLGGAGGGVQVITVMEARSRSFAALRVIGLNRGVFPRRVSEDPLLPDALRRALRDVLPDLPIKGEGHEEERFLFAQLVAAAPHVHLSCAQRDATGRAATPSPLFERAPAALEETEPMPRSPRDRVLEIALRRARGEFAAALPDALADARRALGLGESATAQLADARLAVLRELDPRDARRHELGPFLGAVGPIRGAADPRRMAPFVTHLENAAACPWKSFLTRILGIEIAADARGVLPGARDKRLLGLVVHGALARAAKTSEWPHSFAHEILLEAAREQTEEEGVALPDFAHALARCAAPYVEVARRLDASEDAKIVDVETSGTAQVHDQAGIEREVHFRVDRVDEVGGALRRTDWKAGKVKSLPDHQRGLVQGALLQAHAYAQDGARARYVYLEPDLDDGKRVIEASAIDPGRDAFENVVATLLAARDAGAFVPRLRRPDRDEETSACRWCDLRPACLRGDSGARMRIARWAEDARGDSALERAALAVWRLPGAGT
jgi:PD-(D/E)XK nuclease superfamily